MAIGHASPLAGQQSSVIAFEDDGYTIAKDLDHLGANSDLVDIFNDARLIKACELKKALITWVSANNLIGLPTGTVVIDTLMPQAGAGVILFNSDTGSSMARMDAPGHDLYGTKTPSIAWHRLKKATFIRKDGWYWIEKENIYGGHDGLAPALWSNKKNSWSSASFSGAPDSGVIVGSEMPMPDARTPAMLTAKPTINDSAVLTVAAKDLAARLSLATRRRLNEDDARLINDIASAIHAQDDCRAIAKSLYDWQNSSLFTEVFAKAGIAKHVALNAALVAWLAENNLTGPKKETHVRSLDMPSAGIGVVIANRPYGESLVCFPDLGHDEYGLDNKGLAIPWERLQEVSCVVNVWTKNFDEFIWAYSPVACQNALNRKQRAKQ